MCSCAGVVVLIYFSRALHPPLQASDPGEAQQIAYSHAKQGVVAACLVFLGAQAGPDWLPNLRGRFFDVMTAER